jgi:glycosyltransferase involved in cell wall biosynthesis
MTGQVLVIGRLTGLKGIDVLIRAIPTAARVLKRPLRLTVAGTGECLGALKALAKRCGVEADFKGWVSTEERLALMRSADLLAVPSTWPEPFGVVGIEAGSMGLPAVAFDVGGIGDWLIPGVSGELAPGTPPRAEELAEAVVRALADPSHHQELRVGAWRKSKEFSRAAHVERLERFFQDVV